MDTQPNIPPNRVILEDGRWDWGKGQEAEVINFKKGGLSGLDYKKVTSEQSLEGGVVL